MEVRLIVVLVFVIDTTFAADVNISCITPNGENATCLPIQSCEIIFNTTNDSDAAEFVKQSLCDYGNEPLVCCGSLGFLKIPSPKSIAEKVTVTTPTYVTAQNVSATTTMHVPLLSTFALVLSTVSTIEANSDQNHPLSDKQYCGLQHSDEYFHPDNVISIDEYPWTAALIYKFIGDGTKAILCSGSLINRRYVLTAAQCITHVEITTLDGVRLGEHNTKTRSDCITSQYQENQCYSAVDFGIEEKIFHVNYSRKTGVNDIALLRLDRTIEDYEENIRPICLPDSETVFSKVGDTLFVSGWGRKSHKGEPSSIKKKISTTLITNQQCAKEFISRSLYDTQMCTTDLKNNTGFTCQGDVGAPVMFSDKKNQWHIEGISSWGGVCGTDKPEVHTRVVKYLDWIRDNIKPW